MFIINHNGVKTLEYSDEASDEKHSGLSDLLSGKTVLLNVRSHSHRLGKELNAGIYSEGLVLDETVLNKYVGIFGGWLYFDVAVDVLTNGQSNSPGEVKTTKLDTIFYLDVDKNSSTYKDFEKDNTNYLKSIKPIVNSIDGNL